ncbi:MTFP1.2 family protein [Megaselia abdita]
MSNEDCEDLYRHTLIRFAGYYHEVGQHLNNIWNLPFFLSGFAASYVFSDLIDKCRRASTTAEKSSSPNKPPKKKEAESDEESPQVGKRLAVEASDVLIWHCLATIIIPHLIVGGTQQATNRFLCRFCPNFHYKRSASSIVGLLTIPLLSRLIDHLTTEFLEFTYRPLFRSK